MKLTDQEIRFFRDLSNTESGKFLLSYLRRVQDHVYDSRSWSEGDSKESAAQAARLIQELVLDKIRPPQPKGHVLNQHE